MSKYKRFILFIPVVILIALAAYFLVPRGDPEIGYGLDILINGDFEKVTQARIL